MSTQSTVTFGKYKGQSLSVLISDKPYFKWCQQQAWFQDKFPELCVTDGKMKNSHVESVGDKIKRLEEENRSLAQKIIHNKEEIIRLKSRQNNVQTDEIDDDENSENDENDEEDKGTKKYVVKCVGKCLL